MLNSKYSLTVSENKVLFWIKWVKIDNFFTTGWIFLIIRMMVACFCSSHTVFHSDFISLWNSHWFLSSYVSVLFLHSRPVSISKCQSLSNFSIENLSVSDGEEGNTTDHSHSGTPDVVSTNTDDRLDDKSDDLLSQGSEIPADPCDPSLLGSDGLSEKEAEVRQVRTQLALSEQNYEVGRKCRTCNM